MLLLSRRPELSSAKAYLARCHAYTTRMRFLMSFLGGVLSFSSSKMRKIFLHPSVCFIADAIGA